MNKVRESGKDEHSICQKCKVLTYIPCPLSEFAYYKELDLVECRGLKEFGEKLIDVLDPGNIKSRRENGN